tara:strand:+ start:41 stop:199 length:159 start_codon:yes stop_codon:yes gene_type:complete
VIIDRIIGPIQGLDSRGSRSCGYSYVLEMINAGKIIEIMLIPTIASVTRKVA